MVTVPAHSFLAPALTKLMAAARDMPAVCGVLVSRSWPLTMRIPAWRQSGWECGSLIAALRGILDFDITMRTISCKLQHKIVLNLRLPPTGWRTKGRQKSELPPVNASSPPLASPLLGPDDPAPFELVGAGRPAPLLLICDHASRAVPARLDRLGLDDAVLMRHIGWDIGAAEVTRRLAER